MRLTQKVINAVVLATQQSAVVFALDTKELQAKLIKATGLTEEEFAAYRKISNKLGKDSSAPTYREAYKTTIFFDNQYFKVKLVFKENIHSLMLAHGMDALQRVAADLVKARGCARLIDYNTALSAFATVEAALEAYPELKPAFETVFGVGKV